jgi:hypothetical protein
MTTIRTTRNQGTAVRWSSVEDTPSPQVEAPRSDQRPLYTLVAGEGDGFLLGLAAGDAAGGAWELGYSAVTEQAAVISYELIKARRVVPDDVVAVLRELDGAQDEDPVYRAETPAFRAWLDRAGKEGPRPSDRPLLDGVARAPVVGVAFRKDPDRLVEEALALARMFDRHPSSLLANLIAASATAASCYAQSGRDLIAGVREAVMPVLAQIDPASDHGGTPEGLGGLFEAAIRGVGVVDGLEALEIAGGDRTDPVHAALAALLLAAPAQERFHVPVEQSARIGGSVLGAFAGAMVGARLGIKGWPWAFANDTWFAEIGRRLVRGPDMVEDLPIPYAVEHHLMYGPRSGFD